MVFEYMELALTVLDVESIRLILAAQFAVVCCALNELKW